VVSTRSKGGRTCEGANELPQQQQDDKRAICHATQYCTALHYTTLCVRIVRIYRTYLLDGHDDLDGVERVQVQVLLELRRRLQLARLHLNMCVYVYVCRGADGNRENRRRGGGG
jgi:hypothetical protein